MEETPAQTGLLAGVQVLDLSLHLPGPYATLLMAQLGADVIKVEPPGGDPARAFPRLFAAANQGKRSLSADLKSEAGRAQVRALAAEAAVVVEGWRPGVAARLGVGYEDVRRLNPQAVYCSISGFGQTGGNTMAPGHDLNYQASAGTLSVDATSVPDVPVLPVADLASGLFAAFAVTAALVAQGRGAGGRLIDVSMTDVALTWAMARLDLADGGDVFTQTPHYGVFLTADGRAMALGIVHEEHFWRGFCEVVGLAGWSSTTYAQRRGDRDLRGAIAEAVAGWSCDELVTRLRAADVPASAVRLPWEALGDTHFVGRGTVRGAGPDAVLGHPAHYSAGGSLIEVSPAPALDEHRGARFGR